MLRRARGMRDEDFLLPKLKWAAARPIRSARDFARFLTDQPLYSNRRRSYKKGLPELLKNAREAYLGANENNRHIVINHLRDTASTYLECIDFVGHKAVLHNLTYITSFRLIPPPIRDDLYRRRGHCITLPSLVKIYVVGLGKLIR